MEKYKTHFGKCFNCEQEVIAPNWQCPTGERHQVEPKRYYMDDAPGDPGPYIPGPGGSYIPSGLNLRNSQTVISNLIPERRYMRGHEEVIEHGRNVLFIRGSYETSDPQEQYYLEKQPGLCTKDRWEQVYLTEPQRLQMQRDEIDAQRKRLEQDRNELLAQVKKQNRVGA